jgi:cytidyltransferase-like protein
VLEACVSGAFDDLRSRDVRFLQQASQLGRLTVLLWPDEAVRRLEGRPPEFPLAERLYLLASLRFVGRVLPMQGEVEPEGLPVVDGYRPDLWVMRAGEDSPGRRRFCDSQGIDPQVIPDSWLAGFPLPDLPDPPPGRKKVIVTGCYDWLHSGHVRFFEVVSRLGNLYVSLGSDATVRELKGEGHPLLSQQERRYMVQAVRFVRAAFVASGSGYLDAAPEIADLQPDIYAVNEDGDRPEKREFCAQHGIEYVVLERAPKPGLPGRQSTHLRGY